LEAEPTLVVELEDQYYRLACYLQIPVIIPVLQNVKVLRYSDNTGHRLQQQFPIKRNDLRLDFIAGNAPIYNISSLFRRAISEAASIVPKAAPIVPKAGPIMSKAGPIVPKAGPIIPKAAFVVCNWR
jgi:hypothetical protein